jgi:hypothetical protein
MNHKAIYKLYPTVVSVDDTAGAFDAAGNQVEIDMALVDAWVDPEAYKYQRAREYPSLADFADAYYWAQNGDDTKMTAYIEKCDEVKAKYPKETV